MGRLKGVGILLDSLPAVAAALNSKDRSDFHWRWDLGERHWKKMRAACKHEDARITIQMAGWKKPEEIRAVLAEADLLVVRSIWPEPFGLVGPEAGRVRPSSRGV